MEQRKFWSRQPDPLLARVTELEAQLESLGRVVEEVGIENGKLRTELAVTRQVLSDDLSAMETRLATRLEGVEDTHLSAKDYSTVGESKTEDLSSGGIVKWSERKRRLREQSADPTKFQPKEKPTGELPKE